MRALLRPTLLAPAVWSIDIEDLWRRGIRGVVLDLDNTISRWNEFQVLPPAREWIAQAQRRGMRLCIASNALRGGRVASVAEELGIACVPQAGKPLPRAYRRAMSVMNTDPASTCVVGDQVFTDIVGANWLGIATVLVEPVSSRESPHTRLIRLIERPLRRFWAGKGV